MDIIGFKNVIEKLKYWKILFLGSTTFTIHSVSGLLAEAMMRVYVPPVRTLYGLKNTQL